MVYLGKVLSSVQITSDKNVYADSVCELLTQALAPPTGHLKASISSILFQQPVFSRESLELQDLEG